MTTQIPPAPLQQEVITTRTLEDIIVRTKGLLELIETVCNAAKNDEDVFAPYLVSSLAMMCTFAAQDLALLETGLGTDAADFRQWQLDNMAREAPDRRRRNTGRGSQGPRCYRKGRDENVSRGTLEGGH